jgi:hypothetical protein
MIEIPPTTHERVEKLERDRSKSKDTEIQIMSVVLKQGEMLDKHQEAISALTDIVGLLKTQLLKKENN